MGLAAEQMSSEFGHDWRGDVGFVPYVSKKGAEQFPAFPFQESAEDLRTMIKPRVLRQVHQGAAASGLWIVGAKEYGCDP